MVSDWSFLHLYIFPICVPTSAATVLSGQKTRRLSGVRLIRTKLNDNFAVGIVERDKRKLEHTDGFKLLVSHQNLELHVRTNKNHYLIFHKPIEQWLLDEASQYGISLASHHLPVTLKELTKISKRESSKTDQRFKQLFRDLKTQNTSGINLLAKWIEHLKENNYNTDKTTLQNL